VLVCCLNQATKLARFLLRGPKQYDAVLTLGVATDTQDATGNIIGRPAAVDFSAQAVEEVFEGFKGEIEQHPPVFSALKHKGQRLYRLARAGRPVQKPPRRVLIYTLNIRRFRPPTVDFSVRCSAGTYIRTLCHDIGRVLGCGGHLAALRRTESSGFTIENAVALDDLPAEVKAGRIEQRVVSMAAALPHMPAWVADEETAVKVVQGQPLHADDDGYAPAVEGGTAGSGYVKVIDRNHRLIAVVKRHAARSRLEYCCVFPH
jgi:tRNA pseudouridine55 synthase